MSAQAMSSARKGRGYAAPGLHEGVIPSSFSHRAKPVNEMERSGIESTAEIRKERTKPYVAPGLHEGVIPSSFSHRAKPVNEMERSGIESTAEIRKERTKPYAAPGLPYANAGPAKRLSRSPATVKKECIHHESRYIP